MATLVQAPDTISQALTTSYLANDYEISGASSVTLWLSAGAFTVRYQFVGGDQIEDTYPSGTRLPIEVGRGKALLLNVKAASGTPTLSAYVV